MATKEDRPARMCDSCGGVDDHPRHVHGTAPGDAPTDPTIMSKALDNAGSDQLAREAVLRHFQDTGTVMKHLDCCRADGCWDGTCDVQTQGAETKRGMDLLKHIQSAATQKKAKALLDQREKDHIEQNKRNQGLI